MSSRVLFAKHKHLVVLYSTAFVARCVLALSLTGSVIIALVDFVF